MSATPLTSPDTSLHPRDARLAAVAEFVQTHVGRFPNLFSADPDEAELGRWWREQSALLREQPLGEHLEGVRELAEQIRAQAQELRLEALTAYVLAHDGRFPPNRSADPEVAALGCWWVSQNIELTRQRMSPELSGRLDDLRRRAAKKRAAAREAHARQTSEAARTRARAATLAAGAAGAVAAGKALQSPYLIPGDARVLQLRIEHPDKTLAELAELAGMSAGRFWTKYYGALRRGPNSRSPLKKTVDDRYLAPGVAADMIGVPRSVLSRWAAAGLVAAQRNRQGHRRYLGAEVLRVKKLIAEGWPDDFAAAGNR